MAEKAPMLPTTADWGKLAAEDSRNASAAAASRRRTIVANKRAAFRTIAATAAGSLALLSGICYLTSLLHIGDALAVSSTLSLYSQRYAPEFSNDELKRILLTTPSNDSAAEWLRYYTAGPHLAGQNLSQAEWTRDRWAEWGAVSHIAAYDLFINYPEDHSVALLKPAEDSATEAVSEIKWEIAFQASLTEDVIDEDPTTSLKESVATFHGYSASGNVTGPVVYVNYGTFQDYADLEKANISLKGAVVLARYGGIFRGLKVKRAQELGAVGVLLYSDPGDDNGITEANGYKTYPDGPARQPSSVQRGSVQFLSIAPGDPTTPGYPSKPGVPRGSTERYIPQIPSIPISYVDALPILQSLNGHGPSSKDFGHWWTRNEGLGDKGVDYNVGPTPADEVQVNLYNEQNYTTTPIWNVIGVFNGSVLPNEIIVVGNHRDAWIAGGAVDPNSGSAIVNEVVRSFGVAAAAGWKPLRTVVFASWDGEEYGLLGSTEWVEEYLPWLKHATVAYVNIDTGVGGTHFGSAAVPLVHDLVYKVASEVQSPNQTVPGQTVRDTWDGKISPLGSGSDYTAFLDHAGISSLDVHFGGGDGDPVYHYHSNYDSFHWMEKYGDPGFVYHQTMAQILGLLVAHLATDIVIPFKAADYADALQTYVDKIRSQFEAHEAGAGADATATEEVKYLSDEQMAEARGRKGASADRAAGCAHHADSPVKLKQLFRQALDRLDSAVVELSTHAVSIDLEAEDLRAKLGSGEESRSKAEAAHESDAWTLAPEWWRRLLHRVHRFWLAIKVASVNHRYQYLERKFLYEGGLDEREWFKHVIFAPGVWTGYAGAVFPGLVESIDAGNWTNALRWADIVESRIAAASKALH
ncbi:pa domain-containing protein [Ophiostoma piceae UAMH 11346]|uniref:Pa domain-containing protein n=1 Tax=Ophiostoma piceae (strain UAMH 11346) TaxID=1262450 RepID=S3CQ91_OPHP1|nr:pa domain-containing protein [Ophiostoma piceae UAMH 11346]